MSTTSNNTEPRAERWLWLTVTDPMPARFGTERQNAYEAQVTLRLCTLGRTPSGATTPEFSLGNGEGDLVWSTTVGELTGRDEIVGPGGSYRWHFGLAAYASDRYPMALHQLEAVLSAMRKAESGAARATKLYGIARSFGSFVMQRARALGAVGVALVGVSDQTYIYQETDDPASRIDSTVYTAVIACRRRAGMSGAPAPTEEAALAQREAAAMPNVPETAATEAPDASQ